ncbi:zinc finger protein 600-like [Adelges cooleyi]|uniref:zinc finger protein 600-like n=1 Tax=Adelges cooleyi TaxID=133065 RepID=UPI00217F3ED0|nr:zinc finger protein 600-like [Adelges cooleyi]
MDERESVRCSVCSKQFSSKRKLNHHITQSHNGRSKTEECLIKKEFDENTSAVWKRYKMLKIKLENDETEQHSFEVIAPKPLNVQFKNNEISTTEEYLIKNEVDNTYVCNNDDLNVKFEKECFNGCVFESDIEIVRHELFDAENELTPTFDCNYCQKSFKTKRRIKNHILSIHYPCNEIDTSNCTNSIDNYTRNKDVLFICGICLKSFSSKSNLKRHWRIHTDEKAFKCNVCEKTFGRKENLKTHKMTHTGEKPFRCDICEKGFNTQSNLKTHKKNHTGEKPFRCDVCEKCYNTQSYLKTHKRTHTGEKPFRCNVCERTFRQQSSLKIHKRIHTGEKPYKCDVCAKTFCQQSTLKTHERIHIGGVRYECSVCKKSCNNDDLNVKFEKECFNDCVFESDIEIVRHELFDAENELTPTFDCNYCQKSFKTKRRIKNHILRHWRIHTDEKAFKCNVCERKFSQQSSLKTHERTHTRETLFRCDVCEKKFSQKSNLKNHERIHTGEKPYKCDVCAKTFCHQSNLKTHERIHIGGVRYECSVCKKSYSCQYHLKRHQAKAHD